MAGSITGKLTKIGNVVVDMPESARIIIDGELIAGYNLPTGSKQETIIRLYDESVLEVKGKFLLTYGSTIQVFGGGRLILNSGFANSNTLIGVQKYLEIGDDFLGARNVTLYDSDHHTILQNGKPINKGGDGVRIGKHVWIGVNATVLKGVTIGEWSVVGANSVVTRDIPPRCLAVGNPAKVVKTGISWRR